MFRDQYYPMRGILTRSPYCKSGVSEWNKRFEEEFYRIRCTGQADYNRRRDHALPTWNTMAAMNECKTWKELLEKLSLKKFRKTQPKVKVRILPPDS